MSNEAGVFSIQEADLDGYPLIAMINVQLRRYEPKAAFPWFLSVSAPFSVEIQGLPSSEDAERLNEWEDTITGELTSVVRLIFVGRVTWNGNRELLYYLNDANTAVRALELLADSGTTRPFAFRCERDEGWAEASPYWEGQ